MKNFNCNELNAKPVRNHYNHWLPKKLNVMGTTIGNNIFYAQSAEDTPDWLRVHEMVHVAQYRKYTTVGFLIVYGYQYLKERLKGNSHWVSYMNIPFEIEAHRVEKEYRKRHN